MYKIHLVNVLLVILLFEYSDSYKTYSIADDNLCMVNILSDQFLKFFNTNKNKPIGLEKSGDKSAVKFINTWDSSNHKSARKACTFKVEAINADSETGIYAVIQKLNLRQDERTNKCIDFIKFKLSNKYYSDEICGTIIPHQNQVLTVEDQGGAVKVEIYIDDKPLQRDEVLDIEVAFTRYEKCEIVSPKFPYTTCKSKYQISTCISNNFYKDNTYNCPEPYCGDEGECLPAPVVPTKKSSTSNIALSAVASLIFTMAIVIACIWVCWKYRECMNVCSSDTAPQANNNRSTRTTSEPANRNIRNAANASRETTQMMDLINETETRPRPASHYGPTVAPSPTAPAYGFNASAPIEDKDLPPSYDSLFAEGNAPNSNR